MIQLHKKTKQLTKKKKKKEKKELIVFGANANFQLGLKDVLLKPKVLEKNDKVKKIILGVNNSYYLDGEN